MGARCDAEPRLDHAAEHDAEPERTCGVRHAHRFADPARLRELDVDAVGELGALRDVVERVAVLVDVDRDARALLQLRPTRVAGGERLLAVLDLHLRQVVERLLERPRLVDVDLQRQVGHLAHRVDAHGIELVAPAELQLEALEALVLDLLRALRHVVGVAEPDRPRRGRPAAAQAEQLVHR